MGNGQPLPPVGFGVTGFIPDRATYCSQNRIVAPSGPIEVPRFRQRVATQISANMRQRRRNLHPAIRQHEHRRRGLVEARPKPVRHAERNVAKLHFGANRSRLPLQNGAKCAIFRGGRLESLPEARGGTDAHELAGIEAKRAEGMRSLDDGQDLMNVDPGRRKSDFERQTRCSCRAALRAPRRQRSRRRIGQENCPVSRTPAPCARR